MSFKKTAIATFVGAALSTVALSATAADFNSVSSFKSAKNALAVQNKASAPTLSGMSNQYDAQLGKTTFRWADSRISTPDVGPVAKEHRVAFAADFYLNQLTGKSVSKNKFLQPKLASTHDVGRGALIAKYKQEVAGIEVFNHEFNIMMDREFNLVSSSGYFADSAATKSLPSAFKDMSAAFGNTEEAISRAFTAMGGDANTIKLQAQSSNEKFENFSVESLAAGKQIIGEPRAKKVFYEYKGKLVAAHYVEIETGAFDDLESEYYSYIISAETGRVLFKNNLTSHAADFNYRIYADEAGRPWDSPHGNVIPAPAGSAVDAYLTAERLVAPMVSLSHGPISTGDAWLADDATMTSGNNATAYVDTLPPQGLTDGDYMADVTSANTFDYKYDGTEPEYSVNNRKAAIVNLFYMNNYLHDDYYDHGFDEVSGNAQLSNYGRGGEENDALNVEIQDNSGFNNANMSTPADGRAPRMQMYLYDSSINVRDYGVNLTSHTDIGFLSTTTVSNFGPKNFAEVSGKLVRIEDGTDPINDGCEEAVNADALAGNIAIIDRGACAFVDKVRNAQAAGATAVIIANNRDGDAIISMGGTAPDVTIPNISISQNEGATVYAAMADGDVEVSLFKNQPVFKGSAWDNGTVAHEWGHYISNRLVGNSAGLANQQGRSMGEGWGDFHALLLLAEEKDNLVAGNEMYSGGYSDSTYTGSFVTGIRPYPYSTNTAINPSMFADIGLYPGLVHSPGSIWGNMLWESFIGLVNDERHTFAEAKSLMKDYLVAGYKMTPMAPTYTEARDAILAAAYANDMADHKVILAAFAKRGLGLGAVSPDRYDRNHTGAVNSHKTELATVYVSDHTLNVNYEGLASGYCSNDNILDKGETGTVTFTVKNVGDQVLTGVMGKVEVVSGHNVTLANDGMVSLGDVALSGTATSSPIEFTLNEAGTGEDLVLQMSFPDLEKVENVDDFSLTTTVNVDFVERALVGTAQTDDFNTLSRMNDYKENVLSGISAANGTFQLAQWSADDGFIYASNNQFASDVSYETRAMTVGYEGDYTISFWHYYDMEEEADAGFGYDGGVVEISVNGGDWADVTEMGGVFEGAGYPYNATAFGGEGRPAFTGIYQGVETINFGEALNGNDIKVRFRVASDVSASEDGWYIDDLTFSNIKTSVLSNVIAGDTYACDNRLPTVTVQDNITINEGESVNLSVDAIDPNSGDTLTYSWTQTSGPDAVITGADTATPTVTAPSLDASAVISLEVSVSDGTATVSKATTVTVHAIPTPAPVAVKKSSSGGSTGLIALLLLPLALFRRRK